MSAIDPSDGSEDVTDFLRRVRELGDRKEDTERSRNLEEEIAEGRRLREARRAERARSLSPEKQSPSGTPRSLRSPRSPASPSISERPSLSLTEVSSSTTLVPKPPEVEIQHRRVAGEDADNSSRSIPETPERSFHASRPSKGWASPNSSPRRQGTLSWQQRPSSLRATAQPDFSSSSQKTDTLGSAEERKPLPDEEPTRDAIAKSLASKDPTWFRQTAERGIGSAAYRKSNEDATAGIGLSSGRMKLHGLSKESRSDSTSTTTTTPKQFVPTTGPVLQLTTERLNSISKPVLEPPEISSTTLGRDSQEVTLSEDTRLPTAEEQTDRSNFTSLQTGQTSPNRLARSPSPTKGLSGFVQSAMLSRTNSVTKRWSATASAQPFRPSPTHDTSTASDPLSVSRMAPQPIEDGSVKSAAIIGKTRRSSPDASPSASNSSNTNPNQRDVDSKTEAALSQPTKHTTSPDTTDTNTNKRSDFTTPSSPSKRWSPTKSSWLESALSKPESPKPKPPATKPSQPAWLMELNKNRQHHGNIGSVDKSSREGLLENPEKSDTEILMREESNDVPQKASTNLLPTSAKPSALSAKAVVNEATTVDVNGIDVGGNFIQTPEMPNSASAKSTPTRKPPGGTPPKPDFGARHHNKIDQKHPENLEFQKAFGNLKRTKTENYVAPNEFKDNITKGKAALAITGPQQKSVRKDDFRESLISQRGSMKAKAQHEESLADYTKPSVEAVKPSEPEALAKRRALGRNQSNGNIQNPLAERKEVATPKAGLTSGHEKGISAERPVAKESNVQVKTPSSNSKLADRFNPGLASILAKGRPSSGPGVGPKPIGGTSSPSAMSTRSNAYEEIDEKAQGQLQHLTKSRARGPKRRLPKGEIAVDNTEQKTRPTVEPGASGDSLPLKSIHELHTEQKRTLPKPTELKPGTHVDATKSKPSVSIQSPSLTQDVTTPPSGSAKPPRPFKSSIAAASLPLPGVRSPPIPAKLIQQAESVNPSIPVSSIRSAGTQWEAKSELTKPGALGSRGAIQTPTKQEEKAGMNDNRASLGSDSVIGAGVGLGVTMSTTSPNKSPVQPTRIGSERDVSNSLLSDAISETASQKTASQKTASHSPSPQISEAGQLFADFFDEAPVARQKLEVDTQAILSARHEQGEKVKTIRRQMSEISGDGKIVPVPPNQEHVLFSSNMYLCTHTFSDSKRSSVVETYLWVGSEVADSTMEDVQLFGKNAARQAGGPLVTFRQGKEPARFFEALGGICITRTGTSSHASRQLLLCGRQHLGHITFDEVDFSLGAFSSAFPYIASSSEHAKLFLWKGSGCNAEEIGCARLIIMDLGSDREVIEIEEGKETSDFLSIFSASSTKAMPRSAEFWKQKSHLSNYKARLFLLDEESSTPSSSTSGPGMVSQMWHSLRRPSTSDDAIQPQVVEIVPFCQTDLEPSKIYVLDTFFEIYVLIGSQARPKARAFSAAILFAQDYGILAASTEDRPFVPVSTVVLEGAPRDMRVVFRKWDASLVRTGSLMSGRDTRAENERMEKGRKGLKVLPLSIALAAIGPSK